MGLKDRIGEDWYELLSDEFKKNYLKTLSFKLNYLYQKFPNKVIPKQEDIFNAFKVTRLDNLKAIILGQSPYPDGKHANGVAFASNRKYIPPSLDIILNSINRECIFGADISKKCYLDAINNQDYTMKYWSDQGILLLNSQLTCELRNPTAHKNQGWERFISFFISLISQKKQNISYLAWGKDAERIMAPIFKDQGVLFNNYFYQVCEHPIVAMYRHRPWYNKNCFLKVNEFRRQNNLELISW